MDLSWGGAGWARPPTGELRSSGTEPSPLSSLPKDGAAETAADVLF